MAMLRPAFRLLSLSSGSFLPKAAHQQALIVLATSRQLSLPVFLQSSQQTSQFRSFTSSTPPNPDRLSWDEFLRLRRQRRRSGVIASVPSSMLGIYGGLQYFGSGEIDPTQTILGFDPIMMNSIFVLGCGLVGWLIGPTIGRGVWHILHRRQVRLINEVRLLSFTRFVLNCSESHNSSNISRRIERIHHFSLTAIRFQTTMVSRRI
jgi:Mitochondrial import protein Pam17